MIPLEVRHRAVVHYKHFDRSLRRVCKLYGVSKSSLQRWANKPIESGRDRNKAGALRRRSRVADEVVAAVRRRLDTHPLTTMAELTRFLSTSCNIAMSPRTACRYKDAAGYTRKKVSRVVVPPQDHSVRVRRFCGSYATVPDERVICIDEAAFYVGDIRRYGYAKRGKRLNVQASRTLRRSKLTLIAAVGFEGVVSYKVLAHNCKKVDFVDFIDGLPSSVRGKVAVMDNIQFHHSKETQDAFSRVGICPMYTPAYSPELNAIEFAFAIVKREYRRRCPTRNMDEFNYRKMLDETLASLDSSKIHPMMRHVRGIVDNVLQRPDTDSLMDIGYGS